MTEQSSLTSTDVAIIKGKIPEECISKGIEKLGGISKFINEGEQVFIKFNLNLPHAFPTNSNFNILKRIINLCKKATSGKIFVGSFPCKGIPIKVISDLLGLEKYFENLGAHLAFLDDSNYYSEKKVKLEEIQNLKDKSISEVEVFEKKYRIPKIIIDSDKFIIFNQVNVEPLFKCNLALLNSYSIISGKDREIRSSSKRDKDYISQDQYKQNLISNIIDVASIKKPNIVINDLFYSLENAGPFIYRDSNLKKNRVIILGNDILAVDYITLKLMKIDTIENKIVLEGQKKNLGNINLTKINHLGEDPDNIEIKADFCVSKLEDINLMNCSIKTGKYCSGCFKQAYHLLNLMKTHMIKDLKYNPRNSFLIGENPPDPEYHNKIILYGDCSIHTTKNRSFRKVMKEKKRKAKSSKKVKVKGKRNKNVLEIPGCPPNIFNCIELMLKHYGKENVPNLYLFYQLIDSWKSSPISDNLETWEAI